MSWPDILEVLRELTPDQRRAWTLGAACVPLAIALALLGLETYLSNRRRGMVALRA